MPKFERIKFTFRWIRTKYLKVTGWLERTVSKAIGVLLLITLFLAFFQFKGDPEPYLINLTILSLSLGTFLIFFMPILEEFRKNAEKIQVVHSFLSSGLFFVTALLSSPLTQEGVEIVTHLEINEFLVTVGSMIFYVSLVFAILIFLGGLAGLFKIMGNISDKLQELDK